MKICYVLASRGGVGGLEKHVKELAFGMQKRGHDVVIVADRTYENFFKGLKVVPLHFGSRWNLFTYFQLLQTIKNLNPDIVHAQANKAMDLISKIKPFLEANVVATIHNVKRNVKSFSYADAVIGVSRKVLENVTNKQKFVVYNGIDIEPLDVEKEERSLCAVGRFVYAKGFDLLLQAMHYLPEFRLYLIGGGDAKIENEAKKFENVTLCGYLPQHAVYERVASSQLVVIPSRKEGFSYVFLEALMLQTPVIASDFADIREFIPQQWIVDLDPQKIARAIKAFFSNYEVNYRHYIPFFQNVREKCSIEAMLEATENVYEKVLV